MPPLLREFSADRLSSTNRSCPKETPYTEGAGAAALRTADTSHGERLTTPGSFGGRRWWFRCPRSGRRIAKLYLPNGAIRFAGLKTYLLAYQSQRETPMDRALRRLRKLKCCNRWRRMPDQAKVDAVGNLQSKIPAMGRGRSAG